MHPVEAFIWNLDDKNEQKEIMYYLHELILSHPGTTAKIRYRIPFYYRKTWVCYLNPLKDGRVDFAFIHGNEMGDPFNLFFVGDRKQIRSVRIGTLGEIEEEKLLYFLQEAFLIDDLKKK